MSSTNYITLPPPVIPAKAGIQLICNGDEFRMLDPSLRWDDGFKTEIILVTGDSLIEPPHPPFQGTFSREGRRGEYNAR